MSDLDNNAQAVEKSLKSSTIHRHRQHNNFTVCPNKLLQDVSLSPKAYQMLICVLSFPDDWKVTTNYIRKHFSFGRESVRAIFRELEKKGYLFREQLKKGGLNNGLLYHLTDTPFDFGDSNNVCEALKSRAPLGLPPDPGPLQSNINLKKEPPPTKDEGGGCSQIPKPLEEQLIERLISLKLDAVQGLAYFKSLQGKDSIADPIGATIKALQGGYALKTTPKQILSELIAKRKAWAESHEENNTDGWKVAMSQGYVISPAMGEQQNICYDQEHPLWTKLGLQYG